MPKFKPKPKAPPGPERAEGRLRRDPPPLPPLSLHVATTSAHKLAELQAMAAHSGVELVGMAALRGADGAPLPEVVEDGETFLDNALLKALALVRATGQSALADDSGLSIEALGGAPGVHSARFAGAPRDDGRNLALVLQRMAGLPAAQRRAAFECVLVLAGPIAEGPLANRSDDGIPWRAVRGRVEGAITEAPSGSGGFGYDPIFVADGLAGTFAEVGAAAKAACSHRGRAFAALLPLLTALRDHAARTPATLFLRTIGVVALADALATTIGQGLRHAVKGVEHALGVRPQLGAHERAAVSALLHHALRRLAVLQRAVDLLRGASGPLTTLPDPRSLRTGDALALACLTVADVDAEGTPLPHRAPGEASALRGLLQRRPDWVPQLPAPMVALEKALRTATREVAGLPEAALRAAQVGVHPDFLAALDAAWGPTMASRLVEALALPGPPTIRCREANALGALRSDIEGIGVRTVPVPGLPQALMLLESARITALPQFAGGGFELQDAGSQQIAALVGAEPGMAVADWCAGAGGKTLALAAAMRGRGKLCAFDVHDKRLAEARRRLQRAGLQAFVDVRALPATAAGDDALGSFDRVLVDAPCSSTGALRRTPELRWHLDADWLGRMVSEQLAIALRASRRVRPGGRLIYATCSLMPAENEQVVERLQARLGWRLLRRQRLGLADPSALALGPWPPITGDGFFCAVLEREHGDG